MAGDGTIQATSLAGQILGKAGAGTNTGIVGSLYDIMYQINE